MIKYLLFNSRSGGYQNKLFHKFIENMEQQIPFSCKKNNVNYKITSISDPRLNIFSGLDCFTSIVNNNVIENNTSKFYIGGRKATYVKKYFIGKILSLTDLNGFNLIKNIKNYSFDKIYTYDIADFTKVKIQHLMVVPHYQMGGMLYINRAIQLLYIKYYNEYEKTNKLL
jgi:hypothetical protein